MAKCFRQLFLSLSGRLPRAAFNIAFIALLIVLIVLFVFIEDVFGATATWVLYPFAAWFGLALVAKRLHDHGKSILHLLWLLLPVLGPLWLAVLLCLRRGSEGENQYGDDILARGADYLTVRVGA